MPPHTRFFKTHGGNERAFFDSPTVRSWHGQDFDPCVRGLVDIGNTVRVCHTTAKNGKICESKFTCSTYLTVQKVDGDWLFGTVNDPYYGNDSDAAMQNNICSFWFPRSSICEISLQWECNRPLAEKSFLFFDETNSGSVIIFPPSAKTEEKEEIFNCGWCDTEMQEQSYDPCMDCCKKMFGETPECIVCGETYTLTRPQRTKRCQACEENPPVCGNCQHKIYQSDHGVDICFSDETIQQAKFELLERKEREHAKEEWKAAQARKRDEHIRKQERRMELIRSSKWGIAGLKQAIIALLDDTSFVAAIGTHGLFILETLEMDRVNFIPGCFVHLCNLACGILIVVDVEGAVYRLDSALSKELVKVEHIPPVRVHNDPGTQDVWASISVNLAAALDRAEKALVFYTWGSSVLQTTTLSATTCIDYYALNPYQVGPKTAPQLFWNGCAQSIVVSFVPNEHLRAICADSVIEHESFQEFCTCSVAVSDLLETVFVGNNENGCWYQTVIQANNKMPETCRMLTGSDFCCVMPPHCRSSDVLEIAVVDEDNWTCNVAGIEFNSTDLEYGNLDLEDDAIITRCPIPGQNLFAVTCPEKGQVLLLDFRKGCRQVTPREYKVREFEDYDDKFKYSSVRFGSSLYTIDDKDIKLYEEWAASPQFVFNNCLKNNVERLRKTFAAHPACFLENKNRLVEQTCLAGSMGVLELMADTFELEEDLLCSDALFYSCVSNHLDMAKWIVERYKMLADPERFVNGSQIFKSVCFQGHTKVAQWLFDNFPPHLSDEDKKTVLQYAARYQLADQVQWLCSVLKPSKEFICEHIFWMMCAYTNPFEAVQEFATQYGIEDDDIRKSAALGGASRTRDNARIQQLLDTYSFTRKDIVESEAIWYACARGEISVLNFLKDKYKFTDDDLEAHDGDKHIALCRNDKVVCWLADYFPAFVSKHLKKMMENAISSNFLVLKELTNRFGFDSITPEMYEAACFAWLTGIPAWIYEHSSVRATDAPNLLIRVLSEHNFQFDNIALWLFETGQVSKSDLLALNITEKLPMIYERGKYSFIREFGKATGLFGDDVCDAMEREVDEKRRGEKIEFVQAGSSANKIFE